jgi:hypothetical protein
VLAAGNSATSSGTWPGPRRRPGSAAAGREKHARALRTYCAVLASTLPPELIARFE